MSRTIGIMATYPPRLDELKLVVPSIAPQLDRLVVVANQCAAPPRFARSLKNVECIIPDRDLKDEGKFVDVEAAPDDILFYLDDDIIYPHDYVSRMCALLERYGPDRVALGVHGIIYSDFFDGTPGARLVHVFDKALPDPMVVNQIGTGTAVIKAAHAPDAAIMEGSATFVDVRFAGHCHDRGIGLVCVDRPAGWLRELQTESTIFETVTSRTGALEHICAEIDGFGGVRNLPLDLVREVEAARPLPAPGPHVARVTGGPAPQPPAARPAAPQVQPAATAPAAPAIPVSPSIAEPAERAIDHVFVLPGALEEAALTQVYRIVMGAHAEGASIGLHVADPAQIEGHWQIKTLTQMPAVRMLDAPGPAADARAIVLRGTQETLDITVMPAGAVKPKAGLGKPAHVLDTHLLAGGLAEHLEALRAMPPEAALMISNKTFGRFWNLQGTVFNLCQLRHEGIPQRALVLTGGFWDTALLADVRAVARRLGRELYWLRRNVEELEAAAGTGPQPSGPGWEIHLAGADLTPADPAFTAHLAREITPGLRVAPPEQGEARTGAEFFADLSGGAFGDLSRGPLRLRLWRAPE
ncbi:hypothetical protein [Profundibacterium mesophilum]|uniref:Biotin carboxyl carrier protein of acetyl-CoA carboxylase n=1 Tax=Profundibacterium mesophilum KAUST100406-0324 TaxID=1037889 RepID=A0A921NN75_9RHOB|nr:hypothetical protein [Profundibacterium mesophilum]KAF0674586.1 biotin carboxyl carrier protein of acetyl-CoA carboxylase [Profundibacterium mesophilum KAUST100406-0324]